MKRQGRKHTTSIEGHQDCAICHPPTKGGKAKERRETAREIEAEAAEREAL